MLSLAEFSAALNRVVFADPSSYSLGGMATSVPLVDRLSAPAGTTVLVRADVDMSVKDGAVTDTARVESCAPTLRYCIEREWNVVIFGHLGRKGASLAPVRDAFAAELGHDIHFVGDWLDEERDRLTDDAVDAIGGAARGSVFMLQNTRKYAIEQALWSIDRAEFDAVAARMYSIAADMRERLGSVFVNEAVAASNVDFSSCAVPLVMREGALGFFVRAELDHLEAAEKATVIITSGLKSNKLDDLEQMVKRGDVRHVIVAGALAMALKKAEARGRGQDFSIGRAETDSSAAFYVSEERVEQGLRILSECQQRQIEVVLPVDFVLEDGTVSETIPADAAQQDIGPKSVALIEQTLSAIMSRSEPAKVIVYFNGVAGRFEDPRFEKGTESLIHLLSRITKQGASVYVGGGEGRQALLRYGSLEDAAHAFTAGGTVLKAVAGEPLRFLVALHEQQKLASGEAHEGDG